MYRSLYQIRKEIDQLEKARAMKCLGKLSEQVVLDPNPNASADLQNEYNCKNCDSWLYCYELAKTLIL